MNEIALAGNVWVARNDYNYCSADMSKTNWSYEITSLGLGSMAQFVLQQASTLQRNQELQVL